LFSDYGHGRFSQRVERDNCSQFLSVGGGHQLPFYVAAHALQAPGLQSNCIELNILKIQFTFTGFCGGWAGAVMTFDSHHNKFSEINMAGFNN